MYTIGNIIYGIPITLQVAKAVEASGEDWESLGFETLYVGYQTDFPPGYLGVRLGEFDECEGDFPLSRIMLSPSDEQKAEAEAKINMLSEEIKESMPSIDIYIVWSTS